MKATSAWTFLGNHAHVLLFVARRPDARLREIAEAVGITERAVQRILAELEAEGYLSHVRQGRRNTYTVNSRRPLRHPIERHRTLAELIELAGPSRARARRP
jgi:DNA-binding MarR family transcriptional regulator